MFMASKQIQHKNKKMKTNLLPEEYWNLVWCMTKETENFGTNIRFIKPEKEVPSEISNVNVIKFGCIWTDLKEYFYVR